MTDDHKPSGRPLAGPEAVIRNRHLGWDAGPVDDADHERARFGKADKGPFAPPRSRGQVVVLVVTGTIFTIVGGLLALCVRSGGAQ